MITYLSTYISGLGEVVESALKEQLDDVQIKSNTDTLIVYSTSYNENEVIRLRFLNNSFVLLKSFKYIKDTTQSINNVFKQTYTDPKLNEIIKKYVKSNPRSFRIIVSKDNHMKEFLILLLV